MTNRKVGKPISIAYKFAMIFFKNRMAELGLNQSHHSVLITLYKDQGISQEKLSRKLSVDKATVTRSIRKLVEDGFIERRQDKDDKRSYLLYVTEKGEQIKPDIEAMFRDWNNIVLEGFSDDEVAHLNGYLDRICNNVLNHHEAKDIKHCCQKREEKNNE